MINFIITSNLGPNTATRDLYCVLECDRIHKARTVVRNGDLVFDWDETFELDLFSNRELDFLVYSWDPQYRHKLCYKVYRRRFAESIRIRNHLIWSFVSGLSSFKFLII